MSGVDVVVGAGHNGLVAACYLARAGGEVVVLESLDRPGGGSRTEETVAGYRFDMHSVAHNIIRVQQLLHRRPAAAPAGLQQRPQVPGRQAGLDGSGSGDGAQRAELTSTGQAGASNQVRLPSTVGITPHAEARASTRTRPRPCTLSEPGARSTGSSRDPSPTSTRTTLPV